MSGCTITFVTQSIFASNMRFRVWDNNDLVGVIMHIFLFLHSRIVLNINSVFPYDVGATIETLSSFLSLYSLGIEKNELLC